MMKKLIAAVMACLIALALCACADNAPVDTADNNPPVVEQQTEAQPEDIPEAQTEETPDTQTQQQDAGTEAAFAGEFSALLGEIRDNYHPGTAGSSLTCANYAAQTADLFAKYSPDAAEVTQVIESFVSGMDEDSKAMFAEQLEGVSGMFEYISSEEGAGILEDAGYESAGYEWNDDITALMNAVKVG